MSKQRFSHVPLHGNMMQLRFLLHLPSFIRLYWRLLRDPRVGLLAKSIMILGIAYVVMPLDLLPIYLVPLAGLGLLDDIVVIYLASRAFIRLCPRSVVEEHVYLIDQGG